MKTATLDVGGMLSMLDYQGVEKQLGRIAGVRRASASVASNSATVEYDETVERVVESLKAEAFGVLTEIDVKATMKKKLDIDFWEYRILGACNPPLAHQAPMTRSERCCRATSSCRTLEAA